MTQDILLERFFEPERWRQAIAGGIDKDMRKDQLYQLTKPETRIAIYNAVREGRYRISPPHTAQIPKDTPGEFRTVYVNEPVDRIILTIANNLLFETCPEMIHPSCKSYQKGTGCGKVVQEASRQICSTQGSIIGWKSDLSKYFDSVPIEYIDGIFDAIEQKLGKSAITSLLRDYYHSNLYFDNNNTLCEKYQSLKQGCAVAAFLADTILYHLDEQLSKMDGYYVRYSDDMLFIGKGHKEAMAALEDGLQQMQMRLNPKKVEFLSHNRWFKFLGYSIKGRMISLSSSSIKSFQKEIESRTTKNHRTTFTRALNSVNRYLYKGDGQYSWATLVLPVCNVQKDIDTLNTFVMDCLRAVKTGKRKTGGLGYIRDRADGCIDRGKGRNVKANRDKTEKDIEGYRTLGCMRKALVTCRSLYDTLAAAM